jgi:hypothetical protein
MAKNLKAQAELRWDHLLLKKTENELIMAKNLKAQAELAKVR